MVRDYATAVAGSLALALAFVRRRPVAPVGASDSRLCAELEGATRQKRRLPRQRRRAQPTRLARADELLGKGFDAARHARERALLPRGDE